MNLTLGTLAELKAHLLNPALVTQDTWDATIANLGRGVSGRFELFTGRKFARAEDDTFEVTAEVPHVILPRYPVEELASIELREAGSATWVDQGTVTALVDQINAAAGLVEFTSRLGTRRDRLRLTYTGGYWLDESADGSVGNVRTTQQGEVDLTAADESKAITFDNDFAEIPVVECTIVPPEGGTIILAVPSARTISGFTALLGYPIPATGYKLTWTARTSTAIEAGSSELPEGATERPAELFNAWLLQCEAAWQLRDKLGMAIGEDQETRKSLNLSSLELIPDVRAVLDKFKRFSLT